MKFNNHDDLFQILGQEPAKSDAGGTGQPKRREYYCPFQMDDPEEQGRIDREVAQAREQAGQQAAAAEPVVQNAPEPVPQAVQTYFAPEPPGPVPAFAQPQSIPTAVAWNLAPPTQDSAPSIQRAMFSVQNLLPAIQGMMLPAQNAAPVTQGMVSPMRSDTDRRGAPGGNEYTMMERTASMIRFAVWNQKVYLYNGVCYQPQMDEDVAGAILNVCRDEVIQVGKFSTVKHACEFLKIDQRFRTTQEWLDYSRKFVSFWNGNLNLDDGCLYPHSPDVFTTYAIRANYLGPQCQIASTAFDQVLRRISGGDADLELRIWQMVGYCLTPDIGGKCGFLLQGVTNSGKSLLCNYLSSFFPEETVAALSLHGIGERFTTAELNGAALCTTPDLSAKPLSEQTAGMIKALSGNDLVQVEKKYGSFTKFRFTGKLVMSSNYALRTKVHDPALMNRIVAVPFRYSIPKEAWDPHLPEKLGMERDAVASKAVDAYYQLRRQSYTFAGDFPVNAPSVLGAGADPQNIQGLVEQFLRDHYEAAPGETVFLMDAYEWFCEAYDLECTAAAFGRYFKDAVRQNFCAPQVRKRRTPTGNPVSCFVGLRAKPIQPYGRAEDGITVT